ncbi:hypothetical protein [Streptomyces sp. bgisy159]|uniref:hypothetical protein n=1 Tax=Streptomyces sp. bgisy159 TaxID=3413795 RepID=UPI003F49D4F3
MPAASPPPGPLPSARPPAPPGETRTPPPEQTSAPEPALLTTDPPLRTPTDDRNCENVTLTFHNSGGTAVTSGQVTLGTHIIDSIGIDWATITSTRPLPAPIAPGARGRRTWLVCVDSWRVPLGMRVETRVVAVDWA